MGNNDTVAEVTEERKPRVSHLMTVSIVLGVMDYFMLLVSLGPPFCNLPFWLVLGLLLSAPLIGIAAIARILLSRGRVKGPMSVWAFLGVWLVVAAMLTSFFLLLRIDYANPPPSGAPGVPPK